MKCLVSITTVSIILPTGIKSTCAKHKCGLRASHTVSDEATKVAADNAVPSGALALVKGLLDVLGDILYAVNNHSCGFFLCRCMSLGRKRIGYGPKAGPGTGAVRFDGRGGELGCVIPSRW